MNLLTPLQMSARSVAMVWAALLFSAVVVTASAGDEIDDSQKLKRIIEAQQHQLDRQQQELQEQRELLQELLRRVGELTPDDKQTPVVTQPIHEPAVSSTPAPAATTPDTPVQDDQAEPDWPGSISLFDSQTRIAIGGFVELDVIHDSDAIGAPCQFVTGTIPTDGGTPASGADGQTNFCINTSRLTLETRTPTKLGRLKTFLSGDLDGDALSTTPEPRLRQAYGELEGAAWGGDLLVGQAWSSYVDLEVWPDILDFEGPGSAIAVRQPMVRWSKGVAEDVDVRIALEQPGNGSVQDADVLTGWPDLVGAVKWSPGGSQLRAAGIVRDIRASDPAGPVANATGWGLAGSGKVALPANSDLVFEASIGQGLSGYYNDSPPSGVYDPATSSLELLPLSAYYVGFEHDWSDTLRSSLLYAALDVDNLDSQPDDAGNKSAYFSVNLIWRPDPSLMFGVEFLSGGRRDKSGAEGTVNRIQFSSRFSF